MKKFLGIDYGDAKIGLALGNSEDRFVLPYKILGQEDFWKEIESIIKNENIDEIVIGLPTNLNNEETQQTEIVKDFLNKLEIKISLPIHFEDERMTSLMGSKMIRSHGEKSKKSDDSAAATLILDSFIKRNYGI